MLQEPFQPNMGGCSASPGSYTYARFQRFPLSSPQMYTRKKILCVDDDYDDRTFFCEAINVADPEIEIVQVENGIDAMQFLEHAKMENRLPCLIVLDINMPLLDGKQTLMRIQQDSLLRELQVIVFTSSQNPNDNAFFKSKGVNLVVKPYDVRLFEEIAREFVSACA